MKTNRAGQHSNLNVELEDKVTSLKDKFGLILNDSINAMLHPNPDTFQQQLHHTNIWVGMGWVAVAGAITGFIQAAMLMYVYIDAFTDPVPAHITLSLSVGLVTRSIGLAITAVILLLQFIQLIDRRCILE